MVEFMLQQYIAVIILCCYGRPFLPLLCIMQTVAIMFNSVRYSHFVSTFELISSEELSSPSLASDMSSSYDDHSSEHSCSFTFVATTKTVNKVDEQTTVQFRRS